MEPVELSITEIARRLDAELLGDGGAPIRRLATLDAAGPDALSWLGGPRYAARLPHTRAAAVLVPHGELPEGGPVRIRVPDPDRAMTVVATWFAPPPRTIPVGVHPTAYVAPDAVVDGAAIGPHCSVEAGSVIGPGTQLFPGVRIGAAVRVGRDCRIRENVVIGDRIELGDRVSIFPNATLGADGFGFLARADGLTRVPQIGTVIIEDDVEIGANSCVDRARFGATRIRRGAKIDNLVMIGHNCDVGPSAILAGQVGLSGSVTLEAGVVLGGQVGVADHMTIGRGTQIAAQSGVLNNIPGGGVYRGTPAQPITQTGRQLVCLRRLPAALEALRHLEERVRQLESAANDSTRD